MLFHANRKRAPARALFPLFFTSCLFAPSLSHAAIVTLNNGDQITGEIGQLNNGVLNVKTALFGEVKIPWGNVKKLVSDDEVRVQLSDGAVVKGKLDVSNNTTVAIQGAQSDQPVTVARQNITALNPPVTDDSYKYSGKIDLGGSFNRGNTRDDQLHTNGEFVARAPEDRYTLRWEINEAKSAGITTTSNRRLLAQYDMFLDPKNYLFVNAKAERDELADLNLRTALGGGYGHQFIDTDITKLSGEAGLSYVKEDYDVSADKSFPTLGLGFKYEQKFFNQKMVYFNNFNLDASLEESKDVLLHNRMGIRIPLTSGINLSTQFNIDYDNEPALGKKKTDTALIFSVGYAF
jgi:putative salt-induced outer membrane protein YdiY